jgi:hypothetical protein
LWVISTGTLLHSGGENVNRSPEKGGSYFRVPYADPEYPDDRKFLSGRIKVSYSGLGAAEIEIAVRRPGEPHFLAVLRSPDVPDDGSSAVAVQNAIRFADGPTQPGWQHPALMAVRLRNTDSPLPPNSPITPLSRDDDDSLPPNSPLTPLSRDDDDSSEEDNAVAPIAPTAPTGCKASAALPTNRRDRDNADDDGVGEHAAEREQLEHGQPRADVVRALGHGAPVGRTHGQLGRDPQT